VWKTPTMSICRICGVAWISCRTAGNPENPHGANRQQLSARASRSSK
jgi:hypothetical protein